MHTPMRMCIACRQMKPKGELLKIVKNQNLAELDELQKKFGRGAYICKNADCLEAAKKRRALSRHFKMPVEDEIYEKASEAVRNG